MAGSAQSSIPCVSAAPLPTTSSQYMLLFKSALVRKVLQPAWTEIPGLSHGNNYAQTFPP